MFKNSAALKCAIELGIPDAIQQHGKPMNLSELTSALPINPSKAPYIPRLMCILVNAGIFSQEKEGFALTSAGQLLLRDDLLNARAFILCVFDPAMMSSWHALKEWFQNDDAAPFDTAHGKGFWDYTACEPKLGKLFDEAMASDSLLTTKVLVTECKYVFEGLTSLVDVGGGNGAVSRAIAKTFPNLKCIVYDLPHVVAEQKGEGNLDFVAGDMFEFYFSCNYLCILKYLL